MQSHIRVLAILHIVFGAIGILVGLGMFLLFGGIAGIVSVTEQSPDAAVAIPVLGALGSFLLVILCLLSLPSIIAGVGLLSYRSWARILTIVISVLSLFNFPFGTALGFYGLWVLLSPEGGASFGQRPQMPPYHR